MVRKLLPVMIALVAVLAVWSFHGDAEQEARAAGRHRTAPDLFYNYYVPPGGCGGAAAQLYVSPRPAPPIVGHTYITYQPLLPHEFLYPHCRCYSRYNPGSGWTHTTVVWR